MEILLQGEQNFYNMYTQSFSILPRRQRWKRWLPFHRMKLISTKFNIIYIYLSEHRGDVGEAPLIFTPHNAPARMINEKTSRST